MARIIKADAAARPETAFGGQPRAEAPQSAAAERIRGLDELAADTKRVMLDARQQAAVLLEEAQIKAEAVYDAAAEKGYADGLARGGSEGYAEGLEKGLAEGRAASAEQSAGLVEELRAIIRELSAAHEQILHSGRCELLDFALELASKIVGRVAVRDVAAAQENLRKVLELVDRQREMTVKVNPGQLKALREYVPELAGGLGLAGGVRLVGDGTVSPGGAKLCTGGGQIDATIETQLANVAEALLGSRTSSVDAGCYVPTSPAAVETPPDAGAAGDGGAQMANLERQMNRGQT